MLYSFCNTKMLRLHFSVLLSFFMVLTSGPIIYAIAKDRVSLKAPKVASQVIVIYVKTVNTVLKPRLVIRFFPVIDNLAEGYRVLNHGPIQEYKIYKDGHVFKIMKPNELSISYIDSTNFYYEYIESLPLDNIINSQDDFDKYREDLINEGRYYAISAVDTIGNESPISDKIPINSFKFIKRISAPD